MWHNIVCRKGDIRLLYEACQGDVLHNDPFQRSTPTLANDLFDRWNIHSHDTSRPNVVDNLTDAKMEQRLSVDTGRMARCMSRLRSSTFRINLDIRESSFKEFERGSVLEVCIDYHRMEIILSNSCNRRTFSVYQCTKYTFFYTDDELFIILRIWFTKDDFISVVRERCVMLLINEFEEFRFEKKAIEIEGDPEILKQVKYSLFEAQVAGRIELFYRPPGFDWRMPSLANQREQDGDREQHEQAVANMVAEE